MAWDFLQLNDPAKVAEARGTSWGSALGQDLNPRNPNYQGYRTAPGNVAAANRVGLGSYINQGINSLRGVFQPGSNVGGATTLMRKIALSPVGRVAGAAMSWPALAAYGLYKTPDMINALTARDPNATESSLFGIDLTQNANEQAALPESELQDWGSTMGVIPGDDLPNPVVTSRLNKLDPNWEHQLRMQGIDRGNIDNRGFNFPGILGLAKKAIEPNTPEENFALDYFNRDPQTGRIAGSQVDNVFSGKNPVSAWGKGMSAAGQKRIDTIENTLRTKYNLGDEEIEDVYAGTYKGPVTSQLIQRLQTFKNQHDRYTKDLAGATGGADTKVIIPTTTGGTTSGTGDGPSPHGGGSIEAFRSHSPGGISQAQSRAARGGMDGWNLAQGGRVGLKMGGDSTEWMSEQETITPFQLQQEEGVPIGLQASAVDPMDALNDMSMEVFGKPLNLLNEDEYQMLIDMANDQAMAEQPEGLASLV